jgi:hypothetical protein
VPEIRKAATCGYHARLIAAPRAGISRRTSAEQAVRHVGRQCRRDAQAEQPSRQRRHGIFRRAESSITIELA